MSTATPRHSENEVTILARILGNENGQLPKDLARYILTSISASGTRPACTTWPCGIRTTP